LYVKIQNGKKIIVGCYVDDLIVLHDTTTDMFKEFRAAFLTSHLGRPPLTIVCKKVIAGCRFNGHHLAAMLKEMTQVLVVAAMLPFRHNMPTEIQHR